MSLCLLSRHHSHCAPREGQPVTVGLTRPSSPVARHCERSTTGQGVDIGGQWPQYVVEAFHALSSPSSSSSTAPSPQLPATPIQESSKPLPQVLLADVRSIFTQSGTDRLFSPALVEALRALPNRSWSGANNGDKAITQARLARELAEFSI